MSENIIIADFKVESEAYQALSEIRTNPSQDSYAVLQAQIVKKEDGKIAVKDGFATGIETTDDTLKDTLIGSLAGILAGPLGVLLGGSIGAIIGGSVDAGDAQNEESLLEKAGDSIKEGHTAMLLLAREEDEDGLNLAFSRFDAEITRMDAAELAAEIDRAREVEKQTAKEAREKLRAEKNESFRENVSQKRKTIEQKFDALFGKKNVSDQK